MTANVKITLSERNGRQCASTRTSWEAAIGYSRAIRAGDLIAVTGTVGIAVTGTVGIEPDGRYSGSIKAQARRAIGIVISAIEALGGTASDVVRTRIFMTDIAKWKEVGEVHGEYFGQIRPALTVVEVARLIDDEAMVEIEADAIVDSDHREHI